MMIIQKDSGNPARAWQGVRTRWAGTAMCIDQWTHEQSRKEIGQVRKWRQQLFKKTAETQEGHSRKSQKGEHGQQCILVDELMSSSETETNWVRKWHWRWWPSREMTRASPGHSRESEKGEQRYQWVLIADLMSGLEKSRQISGGLCQRTFTYPDIGQCASDGRYTGWLCDITYSTCSPLSRNLSANIHIPKHWPMCLRWQTHGLALWHYPFYVLTII